MSVIAAIRNLSEMDIQKAFNVQDVTSPEMKERLNDCREAYFKIGKKADENKALNLPFVVVDKLTKTIFSELKISTDSEFYNNFIAQISNKKREIMAKCLYGGSCLIKPFIDSDSLKIIVIPRENYIPCARDYDGNLTEVIISETTSIGANYFTLLEKRKITSSGCQIDYKLFKSETRGSLGKEISLSTLYPDLTPSFLLGINSLGLVEMKTPLLNDVDISADGIPVFEPALELIELCNENEQELRDEFKLGQSRIIASEDMFKKTPFGSAIVDKVFTALDIDPAEGTGLTIFNPELREQSYIARKDEYLRAIETVIGLQRGILSDVNQQEKTAKEIGSSESSYNLTIIDFQEMFRNAIEALAVIWGEMGEIYSIKSNTKYTAGDIVFDFGDGVLYNRDKTFTELLSLCAAGLIRGEVVVAWYYDIDLSTPAGEEEVKKYMPKLNEFLKNTEDDDGEED